MISDGGIIYNEPPIPLWVPRPIHTRPQGLAVRYRTWICDGSGRIIRPGNSGWNTITDYGMDLLATQPQNGCVGYIHLSDTLGTPKRVLTGGTTLSIASVSDPTNLAVSTSTNFFAAGDVGNTLYIDGLGQELKITAYTDAQHVTCATRAGLWLPGITPTNGPFSTAGVHFTSGATLANDFMAFNTFDTTATNYNNELNDSSNSRSIHQRIWLSSAFGSTKTINQLGWSNIGTVGGNVFGKTNLATPDSVSAGQKYRVQLQFFSAYSPINIASYSANWGATIGTYDLKILQERIGMDSLTYGMNDGSQTEYAGNFIQPYFYGSVKNSGLMNTWLTSAETPQGVLWGGDAGFTINIHSKGGAGASVEAGVSDSAYTSGTHTKNRTVKWSDVINISAATWMGVGVQSSYGSGNFWGYALSIFPNAGTITKPTGYWCSLIFPLYWQRQLLN